MEWIRYLGRAILGFVVATLILWVCSLTTKSQRATIKTAAGYNAIMTVFGALLFGIGQVFLRTGSDTAAAGVLVSALVTLVVSFALLMRLYAISFWATIWLAIAMWGVDTGMKKLAEVLF
jgi:hypothetical protein